MTTPRPKPSCRARIWPSWANREVSCGSPVQSDGRCARYGHEQPPTERVEPDPLHSQLAAAILASELGDGPALPRDQLHTALAAALNLAHEVEDQALGRKVQLPVPEWVPELRQRVARALGVDASAPPS